MAQNPIVDYEKSKIKNKEKVLAKKINMVGIDWFKNIAPKMLEKLKIKRLKEIIEANQNSHFVTNSSVAGTALSQITENNNNLDSKFSKYTNTGIHYIENPSLDVAKFIAFMHNITYNGNYPYKEMEDPEYLLKHFFKPEQALIGIYENKIRNELCGCGIFQLDYEKKLAYIRGLMILNEHRKYIDAKRIFIQHIYDAIVMHEEYIDRIYGEVRTAHNIVQYLSESIGFVPHAILFNKDNFTGENWRESDILAITYTKRCFEQERNKSPYIHPELFPIYDHFAQIWNLEMPFIESPSINVNKEFISECIFEAQDIQTERFVDQYGYVYYRLFHKSSGVIMTFTQTLSVGSVEKIQLDYSFINEDILDDEYTKYIIFGAFIIKLREMLFNNEIDYFEWYLPCSDVNLQEIAMILGLSVFGFAPAWRKMENGKLTDCFVFGMTRFPIDESKIKFSEKSKQLYELIKPFL
ncbi:MAG: hypothetical protein ACTSRZ_10835 [Promethearchaeota archaeon]